MSKLSRDLGIAGAITAGILLSLILARLLTADPTPVADPTTPTPAASTLGDGVLPGPTPAAPATTPTAATTASTVGSPARAAPPAASMVLSSGVQVVPRPGRPPQSYRQAPTGLPATPPQPPPAGTPDPAVDTDPAALGAAWLAAMCWYDYRTGPGENTARAAAYGDTSMPTGGNPWVLDEQAWAQVTAGHLGSGCTGITAVPAHTGHDGVDQDTVTLTATQVLTVDDAPYQAVLISLTRRLEHGPDGRWLIGPAVTAN